MYVVRVTVKENNVAHKIADNCYHQKQETAMIFRSIKKGQTVANNLTRIITREEEFNNLETLISAENEMIRRKMGKTTVTITSPTF